MAASELADLKLPNLAIEDAAFAANPAEHFAAARRQNSWLAKCSVGYVVTESKAMREILHQDKKMVMGFNEIVQLMGATGTPWGNFIAGSVQAQSGAVHTRLRDVLRSSFTPRQANIYRQVMRDEVDRLINQHASATHLNFEEFISEYPITVMCRMIGASPSAIPALRLSLEALGLAFSMDPKNLPELQEAVLILNNFVQELVAERRAGERHSQDPDLLDRLLEIHAQGDISEDELYNLLVFLFGAGYDTSKNVLTLIMYTLLDYPSVYERCGVDFAYCRRVINETLRLHSPATAARKVTQEFVFRNVRFPVDTLLMFPWSMSGRDETAATDPDVFNPERSGNVNHFAFGLGAHICLGQFIAKAQIEEGLQVISQRIKNPRLAGPIRWRPFPGVWGLKGLPITFDIASAGD